MTRINRPRSEPVTPSEQPKPARVTRQRRKRLNRDAEYLVLRDIYLEQNPKCVLCGKPADQVHHIVGGTAGRARSLLNSDTWLGVCGICHDIISSMSPLAQSVVKAEEVKETIKRLRK